MKPFLLVGSLLIGLATPRGDAPILQLRDVIDYVADYEIRHPDVPQHTDWYGMTDFDNRLIFTIRNVDLATRRKTVIHELIHVRRKAYNQLAEDRLAEEQAVGEETEALYESMFAH